MIQIREVKTSAEWKAFVDLPWEIYRDDPHWVPPLKIAVYDLLNPQKNPFFKHAQMKAWLVQRSGLVVGRILGVKDDKHNQYHGEKTAFFGFFECREDLEAAQALITTAAQWARGLGMETLRGPMNPSTNHECGLLVEGFDDAPAVMMTYNPPYYAKLLEACGLKKSKDLFAYRLTAQDSKLSDRVLKVLDRLKERSEVTFRPVEMRDFKNEVLRILDIYNDAWEDNWGFVPMDETEFLHLAKDMKAIVDPRLLLIAEVRGEPAGFALTLPDVNQVLSKVKDGKLLPTGLFKLLWNLKGPGRKNTINRCRVITLGIKRKFREAGLGPMFYAEYFKIGPALGYAGAEASWILEDNGPMNRALEQMHADRYKTYRIYDRSLSL